MINPTALPFSAKLMSRHSFTLTLTFAFFFGWANRSPIRRLSSFNDRTGTRYLAVDLLNNSDVTHHLYVLNVWYCINPYRKVKVRTLVH